MISFASFFNELEKIAEEGFVPLSTPQPAPTVSSFSDDHDRKKRHIGSDGGIPSKQLEKKADAASDYYYANNYVYNRASYGGNSWGFSPNKKDFDKEHFNDFLCEPDAQKKYKMLLKKYPHASDWLDREGGHQYLISHGAGFHKKHLTGLKEKKADAKSALIGAGVGAGLAGYRSGMNEWDRRIKEDETPSLSAEERTRRRKQRLKRMAAGVATGAGAGAIGGHFVGKGVGALTHHATEAGKGLAEHSAKVIEEGTVRAGRQLGRDAAEAAKSPAKKGWKFLNTDVRDLGKSGPVRHKSHPFARKVKVSSGSLRSSR